LKIDLHVHCRERSLCSQVGEDEQISTAIRVGLDALVFTDHDRLAPPDKLDLLNLRYAPFQVFGGIEVTLPEEHALVIGIQDPQLESGLWNYPDLWNFVRRTGGFLGIAHPFRYNPEIKLDLESYPPDAIELYSNNTPRSYEAQIRDLAAGLGIGLLSNSDAHQSSRLGAFYNLLDDEVESEAELVRVLKTTNRRIKLVAP